MAISPATKRTIVDVTLALVSQAILWYTVHRVFEMYGSERAGGSKASDKARQGAKKLERLGHRDLHLDEYEREIAAEIIHPDDIDVRFSDIAGLDPLIASLQTSVIFPLIHPTLLASSPTAHHTLLSPPKGVILHGPPGCGKTMLAKALAKESGATFLNIAASVLTNKWFGESNKLVSALFRLARKTQPCIVFIDEIDSFLRERDRSDHEATAMMKAEFMTLWDGLLSGDGRDGDNRVLVLGATNRMRDIDAAFLRRMPRRFEVPLPDIGQREKILRLMLKDVSLSPDLSLARLARGTPRFSSSDLKELCRNAAMAPVREMYARAGGSVEGFKAEQEKGIPLRPLEFADFLDQDGGGMQVLVDYDEPLD